MRSEQSSNPFPDALLAVLRLFLPFALISILLVWLAGLSVRDRMLQSLDSRMTAQAALRADQLNSQFETFRQSVSFLSVVPPIQGIVRASLNNGFDAAEQTKIELWQRRLQTIFEGYVATNPDLTQLRFIGIADSGRELIRVDRRAGKVIVVPPVELQSKADRDYFRACSRLSLGEVYISDINLNREHGKVEVPHVVTIRVATPVFSPDGKLFGMIVMNLDASRILAAATANLPSGFQAYVTNATGHFLAHPETERCFGFDLGNPHRWTDSFTKEIGPGAYAPNVVDYASSTGLLHTVSRKVDLDRIPSDRFVTITFAAPDSIVASDVNYSRLIVSSAILGASLMLGGVSFIYGRQHRRIQTEQANLAAIAASSNDAIIGCTVAGEVTQWNRAAERIFGYRASEAVGKTILELVVPPELAAEEADLLARIGRAETVPHFNTVRMHRDGRRIDVSVTVAPILDGNGRVIGASKTARDITAQLSAEQSIRRLNESLEAQVIERTSQLEKYSELQRAILTNAGVAIIASDTRGIITVFNPAAERMLGYSADEVIGKMTPERFHVAGEVAERAKQFSSDLGVPIEPGYEVFVAKARLRFLNEHEWTYIRKDGSRLPALLSVTALWNSDGVIDGFLGMALDISRQQNDRQKLMVLSDQLRRASEVAELGIWKWNVRTDELVWNGRMFEIYGLPPETPDSPITTLRWHAAVHDGDREYTLEKLQAAIYGDGSFEHVFRIRQPSGKVRYIQAAATTEFDETGAALQVVGINRDVTNQLEHEAALQAAKKAADSASQFKSEFLANMSHEIRTPMTAILGYADLLADMAGHELPADHAQYVDTIIRNGHHLLRIINDILDLSKIEAGKLLIEELPTNLRAIVEEIVSLMRVRATDKNISLDVEWIEPLPVAIATDPVRLRQILVNLVGNAIKFTEIGGVTLTIQPSIDEDKEVWIEFAVRDSGIGMTAAQMAKIFQPFHQADASMARRFGGTGLGLVLSKRFAEMLGGSIALSSEIDRGSVFTVRLPATAPAKLTDSDLMRAPPPPLELANASLSGVRILLAEDGPDNQRLISFHLRKAGATVTIAPDGSVAVEEAMKALNAGAAFHVILMDMQMPILDGYSATRELRRQEYSGTIFALTAHAMSDDARKCLNAGCDGHFTKPIDKSTLIAAIAGAVKIGDEVVRY